MSRYTVAVRRRTPVRNQQLSPVWRGIGCLLMLIVPLSAWILAAASVSWAVDQGWPIPIQLLGYPVIPMGLWNIVALRAILAPVQGQFNLYAIVAVFVAYTLLEAAVISLLWAILYRLVGPPLYSDIDAPPPPVKVRNYKR